MASVRLTACEIRLCLPGAAAAAAGRASMERSRGGQRSDPPQECVALARARERT